MHEQKTFTRKEVTILRKRLDELQQIESMLEQLDNVTLWAIYNASTDYDNLLYNLKEFWNVLQNNYSYDIFLIGDYAYSYTDQESKYHEKKEVYKANALTYANAIAQVLAYQQYNIVDDLHRVREQEHADHIEYLRDIGVTEKQLYEYGLLEITLPISACPYRYAMALYGDCRE